jgi:hypothetical protein
VYHRAGSVCTLYYEYDCLIVSLFSSSLVFRTGKKLMINVPRDIISGDRIICATSFISITLGCTSRTKLSKPPNELLTASTSISGG